jgi:NAD+ synthase
MNQELLSDDVLRLDERQEIERIAQRLRESLGGTLKRRGLIVAMSGGIDSSCCAALAVRAVGAERVLGLIMPERDSSSSSGELATLLARHLGIETLTHDIAPALEALGCYRMRDEAVKRSLPAYAEGWRMKIVLTGGTSGQINRFKLVASDPEGNIVNATLRPADYLQIVAATNFKQRVRKTLEYCHADRLHYAVIGTPNRLEYDQGFFVKNGDGSADVKPIAHLYKSQVYALARAMELPPPIVAAQPTTDTYSLPQGQDEFYFSLPYQQLDLAMWALNHAVPATRLAQSLGVSEQQAQWIYADIEAKRRATRYLHLPPQLLTDSAASEG